MVKNELLETKVERVNIRVSSQIKDWFVDLSTETGISMSSLMAMALKEYIDQKEGLKAMGNIQELVAQMEKMRLEN